MKNRRLFPLFCFLFIFAVTLYAQETQSLKEQIISETLSDEEPDVDGDEFLTEDEIAEQGSLSSERRRIEMEIKTSTLPELAAWCRSLGLSEGGTRTELANRLREHYELPEPEAAARNQKILTIESAQTAEYFSIEVTDEDYARLTGDVRLTLKDQDTVHSIRANEVLFNRTRNIITAKGGVIYEKTSGDTVETFRGENITVNIDNWSSVFLDGDSERTIQSEQTAYLFSGEVISRTNEDVTILNNAQVSNASDGETYWSISASKIWLLPGSDFAIFNAWLKVGEIPVLYIPFFYFPVDEVIFHPVIGSRSREGAFVQTTTYVFGRPKANSEEQSSLSRIMGNSNDMEKERHGLFLRSTGKKMTDPSALSLKFLLDHYVNLGTYTGFDLSIPKKGILNSLDFSMGLGFTRTITQTGQGYTPYAPDYDGSFDWNSSNFFSYPVPFRYRIELNGSLSGKYGSINLRFPYFSDPFVNIDFTNRSESMDWVSMLQQGTDEETSSENELGSYQWELSGNINPSFPSLAPYISRIAISNISMTLNFKTVSDVNFQNNQYSPGRRFYIPEKYTIYNFSGSVTGTPLTLGGASTGSNNGETAQADDPFIGIGTPIPPWTYEEEPEKISSGENLVPPVLNQRFDLPPAGDMKFSIDYQLSPISASELQFMTGNWKSYDEADWSEVQSILTNFEGNGSVNLHMDHSSGLFANLFTFSIRGTWRDYVYLNEEADIFKDSSGQVDENEIERMRRQQYSQTNYLTSYTYSGTLRPLYQDPVFSQSSLQYTFRGTLVRSKRYTEGDGPELAPQWGAWVKEKTGEDILGLNSHQLTANVAANVMDNQQTIRLAVNLPPLDGLVSTNASFKAWITDTNINFNVEKPEGNDDWIFRPVNFRETLKFGNFGSFNYYMVLDPEQDNQITNISSTLKLWDFTAVFSAIKAVRYYYEPDDPSEPSSGGKWQQEGDPVLYPDKLSLTYVRNFPSMEIIRNRMSLALNVDTSLNFNLQQYTSSNFKLSMGITTRINGILELNLSTTTENSVIFRYFKGISGMEDLTYMYADGDQNNLFIDLFDSFNFFDETKRRRSGFKMTGFTLRATHFLGDWEARLTIAMFPHLNTTLSVPKYEIKADVTFLVQWAPISEIKSDITYEGRYERWTIK
jgi:lipopolysaccharide assembly outer membrane protein LptD (OstA)